MAVSCYEAPSVVASDESDAVVHNEFAWYVVALGVVIVYWGSAWGFCKAVCGWNGVISCKTKWYGVVEAVCR